MRCRLLLIFFMPLAVSAQEVRPRMNRVRETRVRSDSTAVFTVPERAASKTTKGNVLDTGKFSATTVTSTKLNTKYKDLLKKLDINLNPAHPVVEYNYLGCCACCVESTVKTFSPVGVYTFTPNNNGSSSLNLTINAIEKVQYLVRITGKTNQARNFMVYLGPSNTQGFNVPANDFEITFIAKPQTSGNFSISLSSTETGMWSFYNCHITEL